MSEFMQSRRNLKKHNNRNNLYLVLAGFILIFAVIFGVISYNNHIAAQEQAKKFATTHFNPNVNIYGVKVGKLTINKATKKINKQANNVIVLEKGKVSTERDPNIDTINKQQVTNFFKKQHTTMPSKQNYIFANNELDAANKKMQTVSDTIVNYKVANKIYKLEAKKLINQAVFKQGKYTFTNSENLVAELNKIDRAVSTIHQKYTFAVPTRNQVSGKKITVKNQSYGWGIYVKKAQSAVEQAFLNGTKTLDGKDYIYGLGYSTYGLGYGKTNHGIGNNYIVVSLKKQELWVVKNGKLAVHLNDIVTGTKVGNKSNVTPEGVWYIHYKQSPATLRGRNNDGSKYASPVKYWMPFTLSGCGFHDASWRSDWSKRAYLRGGSHGCVNIKPSEVKYVWSNISKHEPVIIYN